MINVPTIQTVVNGQLRSLPVLTPSHVTALHALQSGAIPSCSRDVLDDLAAIGWLTEVVRYGQN